MAETETLLSDSLYLVWQFSLSVRPVASLITDQTRPSVTGDLEKY